MSGSDRQQILNSEYNKSEGDHGRQLSAGLTYTSHTYFFLVHNSVIDVECSYVFSCTQIGNFSSQKLNHHYTYVKAQKDKTSIESTDEDRSF